MSASRLIRRALYACFIGSVLLMSTAQPVAALSIPPAPTDIPVVDQTNTLNDAEKQELAGIIAAQREKTGNQLAVLMIPSLEGEVLEEYSLKVAREWGVGGERNNGMLLLIAINDRQLRIEVGYGLEGALTDARASQIIRDRITPELQQGRYFAGLKSGLEGISTAIEGEVDPALTPDNGAFSFSSIPWEFVAFVVFAIPSWLGAMLARTKSWWAGGVIGGGVGAVIGFIFGSLFTGIASAVILAVIGLFFDKTVSANYQKHARSGNSPSWWAGGPYIGGGGSGGGFGGFGGGSFGGGGASGRW